MNAFVIIVEKDNKNLDLEVIGPFAERNLADQAEREIIDSFKIHPEFVRIHKFTDDTCVECAEFMVTISIHVLNEYRKPRMSYEAYYFKDSGKRPFVPLMSGLALPLDDDGICRNVDFIECDFHPVCDDVVFENCTFCRCSGHENNVKP